MSRTMEVLDELIEYVQDLRENGITDMRCVLDKIELLEREEMNRIRRAKDGIWGC